MTSYRASQISTTTTRGQHQLMSPNLLDLLKNHSMNMTSGFDPHTDPHFGVTFPQLTLVIAASVALLLWLQRLPNRLFNKIQVDECRGEDGVTSSSNTVVDVEVKTTNAAQESGVNGSIKKFSHVRPPTTLDEFLFGVVEFTLIMLFFYASDYRKVSNQCL